MSTIGKILLFGGAAALTVGILSRKKHSPEYFPATTPIQSNEMLQRQYLVQQIFAKYGNDPNKELNETFLMQQTIPTLQGVLDGTIH